MKWIQQNPIITGSLLLLTLHSAVVLLGFVWEPLLTVGFFTWPYPALLMMQKVLNPGSLAAWAGGLALAFPLVACTAWLLQRLLARYRLRPTAAATLAVPVVVLPLAFVTGLVYLVATALSWRIGE